jgi:hypothetical protein
MEVNDSALKVSIAFLEPLSTWLTRLNAAFRVVRSCVVGGITHLSSAKLLVISTSLFSHLYGILLAFGVLEIGFFCILYPGVSGTF